MKKSDFTGTGKVFSFTLAQYLKDKSTISVIILMLVMSVLCMFIMAQSLGSGSIETFSVESLVIVNDTPLDISVLDITSYNPLLTDMSARIYDGNPDSALAEVDANPKSAAVIITAADDGQYNMTVYTGSGSDIPNYNLQLLTEAATDALDAARYRAAGVSDEQLAVAFAPYNVESKSYSDFTGIENENDKLTGSQSYFAIAYAYSIIVMILVTFSTSYIIRSIIEEKSSKLVELLMVSVKPLALLLGKILATMCFMVLSIAVLAVGFTASAAIMSQFLNISISTDIIASAGIDLSFAEMGLLLVFVVLVSVILGYLTFSIIGGIAGACCSSMEDMNSANGTVTMLTLLGYMVSLFTPLFGSSTAVTICSVLPIISVFTAPVSFATGVIGFGTLCLSWVLQIIVIALLAAFGARVYSALIIHRGNRIRLGQLLKLARSQKKGV